MRYLMRQPDGREYVLECHAEHLLTKRAKGKSKEPKVGQLFKRESKLDGSTILDKLVKILTVRPLVVLSTWARGHRSYAMGINPDQRIEAMKADAAAGLSGVTYDEHTGDAIFSSPGARKRYCEAHGFFDRNGGYGDPQKRDSRERELRHLPQMAESDLPSYV